MDAELFRTRINARLMTLGINRFEAERRAGLKRGFLNDFLIGKKDAIRAKALPALAGALECEIGFLDGTLDTPTRDEAGLPLAGIAEAGVWREPGAAGELPAERLPIPIDPRFPRTEISAYLIRGDHAAGLGITGGSVITVHVVDGPFRDGDYVLAERERGGLIETTVRVVRAGALSARPSAGISVPEIPISEAKIVGLLINSIRVFGFPN